MQTAIPAPEPAVCISEVKLRNSLRRSTGDGHGQKVEDSASLLPHDPSIQLNLPLPPSATQLPKCSAINVRNQAGEIDVIESVEHVSSKLELEFLGQPEVLGQ